MHASTRYKLHFGPYHTPTFRVGQRLECQVRGVLRVAAVSDGRISWPIGRGKGGTSLVVRGSLAKAIRMESINAVAYWWGVTSQTVTKWRRRLGLRGQTVGTSRIRIAHFGEPWADEVRRKAWKKARDPGRRAKIAAAKRGKKRSPATVFKMSAAMTGRKLSAETRRKMSATHKARGTRPPKAGKPWEAWEDELVCKLTGLDAAKQTGRTYSAVKSRRRVLKVPDGRSKGERQRVGRS